MSNPARNTPKKMHRIESAMVKGPGAEAAAQGYGADVPEVLERVEALRTMLYDSEKICQWLSSAINTPTLPAGVWIYVDLLRMNVLGGMRAAQLLQLRVRELVPEPPAKAEG